MQYNGVCVHVWDGAIMNKREDSLFSYMLPFYFNLDMCLCIIDIQKVYCGRKIWKTSKQIKY